jgi:hypothetical protein
MTGSRVGALIEIETLFADVFADRWAGLSALLCLTNLAQVESAVFLPLRRTAYRIVYSFLAVKVRP